MTEQRLEDAISALCCIPDDFNRRGDVSAIDRQLSLLAAVSASIRRLGGKPSTALIDELLDERIASRPTALRLGASSTGAGYGNANQRDDRTDNGPGGGVAHRAAPHYPEAL